MVESNIIMILQPTSAECRGPQHTIEHIDRCCSDMWDYVPKQRSLVHFVLTFGHVLGIKI